MCMSMFFTEGDDVLECSRCATNFILQRSLREYRKYQKLGVSIVDLSAWGEGFGDPACLVCLRAERGPHAAPI